MPYRFGEARLQAGLTTVQLAQKIGLTQAAVISGNPAKNSRHRNNFSPCGSVWCDGGLASLAVYGAVR